MGFGLWLRLRLRLGLRLGFGRVRGREIREAYIVVGVMVTVCIMVRV